jgi:histidyl-tRNA synthetase
MKAFMRRAEACGIADWLVFDPSIVRGLAYYTGLVFEGYDASNDVPRAIFGGGRYDTLLLPFGGAPIPACGFGFGDAVIFEMLTSRNLIPVENVIHANVADVVVFAMEAEQTDQAASLAQSIRTGPTTKNLSKVVVGSNPGNFECDMIRVDLVLETERKPKWVFKHAARIGAKSVVMLAPVELVRGCAVCKCLTTGCNRKCR